MRRCEGCQSGESGYAYIMALFLMLVMILGSQVVLRNLITQGRRAREKEAIWRGSQYIRAVQLYYRKTGHYPQTVEDLQKGLPGIHFLRLAAYKDPMNTDDGSWRFIYINGTGQIIGSVKYGSLQQMAIMDMSGGQLPGTQQGGLVGMPVSSMGSNVGPGQTTASRASPGAPSDSSASGTQNPLEGQSAATNQLANIPGQPQPTGPVDGPVLGGFLTGVASKVDRPSIRVYKGGKTYNEWEFIWNPLEEQARAMQNGLTPQGSQPGLPGLPIAPLGGGAAAPTPNSGGAVIPPPASTGPPPSQ